MVNEYRYFDEETPKLMNYIQVTNMTLYPKYKIALVISNKNGILLEFDESNIGYEDFIFWRYNGKAGQETEHNV